MSRRLLIPLLLLGAAAGLYLSWTAFGPTPPRYNVVLISIDSLVRDRLGLYGHRPEFAPELRVSPNLDALAAEGVVFDDAHTTTSWTLPSHLSILTGLSDGAHEVSVDKYFLDPLRRSLAQEFQRAGATTAGFYSGPYLDPFYGFGRGFDRYESGMMSEAELNKRVDFYLEQKRKAGQEVSPQDALAVRDRLSHIDITSPRVNRMALDFLDQQPEGEPFFLFLHYFDAHYDYMPDELEAGLGARFDPDYRGQRSGMNWMFDPTVRELNANGKTERRLISERDLKHVQALYDAEIHYVDRHIGQVLRKLRERGLWENTIVCVVSDHGDEFFEHGSVGHRSTLFPEQTEMALVLRVPTESTPGQRVPALARSYDVAPTLLDYCALPPMAEAEGSSLRPLIEGSESAGRQSLHRMFGDWPFREGWRDAEFAVHRNLVPDPERMQRHPNWLFVQQAYGEQGKRRGLFVFDRREDPDELRPLPESDPRFATALERYRAAFEASEAHRQALPVSLLELRYTGALSAEAEALLSGIGYADAVGEFETEGLPFPQIAPLPLPGEDRSSWSPPADPE